MEMTIEQKRALALAKAKARAKAKINSENDQNHPSENSWNKNLGLGLVRSAQDLYEGPRYLGAKGLELLGKTYGKDALVGGAAKNLENWAANKANEYSALNEQNEEDYQRQTSGSAAAGFGRVGGNVASAFIPGTGQVTAAKKINDLWQSGQKLKSLAAASGLGATQSALFGTKTNDDSLINNAASGAAFGPLAQGIAGTSSGAIQLGRKLLAGKDGRVGGVLQRAGQDTPKNLINRIYSGNNVIVEGSNPTTAQAAMNPGLSQLDRTIRNRGYGALVDQDLINNQARIAALDSYSGGVAPGSYGVPSSEAAQNAGEAIRSQAQALKNQLTGEIDSAYNHPDLSDVKIGLPDQESAIDAIKKYFPGIAYKTHAPSKLKSFADELPMSGQQPNPIEMVRDGIWDIPIIRPQSAPPTNLTPLKEFDSLRSLMGSEAANPTASDKASAAYSAVKHLFNDAEKNAIPVEWTPEQAALLKNARNLFQQNIDQFETGPAKKMWSVGNDNLPVADGAEVAKGFFNSRASQVNDIDQFRKMLPDGGVGQKMLQKYAISDLLEKALNASDVLSPSKYRAWTNSRAPAIKGLFDGSQVRTLNNIGDDLARAYEAQNLGMAPGSNTIQNAMGSSMLDGGIGSFIKKKVPFVGDFIDRGVNGYNSRVTNEVGDAMLDPNQAINALEVYQRLMNPNIVQKGLLKSAPLVVPAFDY